MDDSDFTEPFPLIVPFVVSVAFKVLPTVGLLLFVDAPSHVLGR